MNLLQPDEIRQLTEIGFLAAARGDLASARTIFGALEKLRPHAAFPYIGLAMAQLNRRKHDDALRTLDRALLLVPPGDAADVHAVRALVLHLAKRPSESTRSALAAGAHPLALALVSPTANA